MWKKRTFNKSGGRLDVALWAAAAVCTIGGAAAACIVRISADVWPVIAFGAGAVVAAALSFVSSYFRLLLFIGGALVVMQSDSSGVGALKPVYLAFVVFAALAGLIRTRRLAAGIRRSYRPLYVASGLLLGLVVLESLGSVLAGADVLRAIRDATTYVMIVAAPFIASDASMAGSEKRARISAAAFSLLAAAGFAVYWLSARGVGTLGIDRFGMFSFVLAGCGFALGMAYGLVRRSAFWVAIGLLCLVSVLVTGTRTGIMILAALVAMVGSKGSRKVPPSRMVLGLGILGLILVYALPAIGASLTSSNFLAGRTSALLSVFSNGVASDQSGVLRLRELQTTLDIWANHPLFGVGFGARFPSAVPLQPPADFQLDSPALVLAKFGVIGTLGLVAVVLLMAVGIARFHVHTGVRSEAQTAGLGLVLVCFALSALALPLEDKGFGLGFALIFYLLGAEARAAVIPGNPDSSSSPEHLEPDVLAEGKTPQGR